MGETENTQVVAEDLVEDPICSAVDDTVTEERKEIGTQVVSENLIEDPFCSAVCDTDTEESKRFEVRDSENVTPF